MCILSISADGYSDRRGEIRMIVKKHGAVACCLCKIVEVGEEISRINNFGNYIYAHPMHLNVFATT